jgi:hypothetical protein
MVRITERDVGIVGEFLKDTAERLPVWGDLRVS